MSRPRTAFGQCLQYSCNKLAPSISPTMTSVAVIRANPTPRSLRYSMSALNMRNAASKDCGRARVKRIHKARTLSPPRNCSTTARSSGLAITRCCSKAAASDSAHATELRVLSSSSSASWVNSAPCSTCASTAVMGPGLECSWSVGMLHSEGGPGFWASDTSPPPDTSKIRASSTATSVRGALSDGSSTMSATLCWQAHDSQANHIECKTSKC
mmetsp:Transcript_89374/g.224739  ORF Transcript_89374/g.224739 Transcript_89374/m.224739 type:complete len:213 (+) Transcript_89374:665-1303(+)